MEYNHITNIASCYTDIPHLFYYSHIPTAIVVLLVGFFVLFKSKENKLAGKILFLIAIFFTTWVLVEGTIWFLYSSLSIMLLWSFLGALYVLIHFLSLYFIYVAIDKKDISFKIKYILIFLLIPVILFSSTSLNLESFDAINCQATEGVYFMYYRYFLGIISILWIIGLSFLRYKKAEINKRKQILLLGSGVISFLFLFSWSEISGSITQNFEITQYGLFGMPVFIGFLVYSIVKYEAFNIKLISAQALVAALILLIGSQFAFIRNDTNKVLTGITLLIVILFGWWLVRSVKKEIKQKEELAEANLELKKLDGAKNEFLNIASHQLRTPVTVIKGVISMLQDGTMDSFDEATKNRFFEGAKIKCQKLEDIINDILNATSLINKKFNIANREMDKINVREFFEKMIEGFKPETMKKKIELSISSLDPAVPEIYGQKNYLEEAFTNLISNAIKYTPAAEDSAGQADTGSNKETSGPIKKSIVEVSNRKEGGFIIFSVKDNGIGIPAEAIPTLFKKFTRAENAIKMYTDGTGLGLFIVKEVIEGHGGQVWIESQLGHGSEFFVKLPIKPVGKVNITEYIKERADMKI